MLAVTAAQLTTVPCNTNVCSVIIFQNAIFQGPLELRMLESHRGKQKSSPVGCLKYPSHILSLLTFLDSRLRGTKSILSYEFSELNL